MTHDELLAIALARVKPETAARAAAARALNDIELSNLVLKAAEVDVVLDLADEVRGARAEVELREKAVKQAEEMLGTVQEVLKREAKQLGIKFDENGDIDVKAMWRNQP